MARAPLPNVLKLLFLFGLPLYENTVSSVATMALPCFLIFLFCHFYRSNAHPVWQTVTLVLLAHTTVLAIPLTIVLLGVWSCQNRRFDLAMSAVTIVVGVSCVASYPLG